MNKVLLDTDILSEVMKARDPHVIEQARLYRSAVGPFTVSAVTVMEVVKGFHKKGRVQGLRRFIRGLSATEVLTFDRDSGEIAGSILSDLELKGQPIGVADVMIAAIALRHELALVTGNLRHYRRIQDAGYDLRLENWREEQ